MAHSPRRHAQHRQKTPKTHDWFDAKSTEMRPVIESKRTTLIEYKHSPSEMNLRILRAARIKVQQTARRCANEYIYILHKDTTQPGYTDSRHNMEHQENVRCNGIKKALGPTQRKTAPLSNPPAGIKPQAKASRWKDGWNTIITSISDRTPCCLHPWMPSNAYPATDEL